MLAVEKYSKKSLKSLETQLRAHLKEFFSEYVEKYRKKSLETPLRAHVKGFFSEYEGIKGLFEKEEYWSAKERYTQDVYDGSDFNYFKMLKDNRDDVGISYDSRIVHCLEMPLEDLPLYLNSYDGLVQITVKWRLKEGI